MKTVRSVFLVTTIVTVIVGVTLVQAAQAPAGAQRGARRDCGFRACAKVRDVDSSRSSLESDQHMTLVLSSNSTCAEFRVSGHSKSSTECR